MQPQSINETDDDTDLAGLEIAVQQHARELQRTQSQNNVLIFRTREERRADNETL